MNEANQDQPGRPQQGSENADSPERRGGAAAGRSAPEGDSFPEAYVVRYGIMRSLAVMNCRLKQTLARGDDVIVRSNRGLERGVVLCEANNHARSVVEDAAGGNVLRLCDEDDLAQLAQIDRQREEKFSVCRRLIGESGLDMQLIDIEQLFGGERIIVYYLSEQRVDFRQLVKELAGAFQTRIEMRQIGVRDEAKLMADFGDCGKPVCCNTHLSKMPPVSMRMAKLQKATLDPSKISGRCGRLKCCLRYEFDTYEEIQKQLPPIGATVVTRDGKGRVLNHEILAEQVLLETEDHRRIVVMASEILSVINRKGGKSRQRNQAPSDE